MFKRLEPVSAPVTFTFDGVKVTAQAGETVAAALFAAGITTVRKTPTLGTPRGPFCMMGACYDCLINIDGTTVQACMTPVCEGLIIKQVARP